MEKRMLGIGDLVKMQNNDTIVWTVLGSCVSIIFHIPGFFSLMCHAQLPLSNKELHASQFDAYPNDRRRYVHVDTVLAKMMTLVRESNISVSSVDVSLLGGAGVLRDTGSQFAVGAKNVEVAKRILAENGYIIRRDITGGKYGITVWYNPKLNEITVRRHAETDKIDFSAFYEMDFYK
ncbi:MAG TPA: chemotaxis protein CheD [Treponemataceae bacterium]|jgi:chemotaxis receptor (MCP) glutamine deamidase CheD|nr:chemotaxis protein CheD [Treponemataceae bacterium]